MLYNLIDEFFNKIRLAAILVSYLMDSGLRRRRGRDGVKVNAVLRRVMSVVLDRLPVRVPVPAAATRSGRRGRSGGGALEEPLDLEELGGAEKVLQLVLRDGDLSGVDEPEFVRVRDNHFNLERGSRALPDDVAYVLVLDVLYDDDRVGVLVLHQDVLEPRRAGRQYRLMRKSVVISSTS